MSLNLLRIAEGWAKTHGLLEVSEENNRQSQERLKICAGCDQARESKALEVIKGTIERLEIIYCPLCSCPCHEKSIVPKEHCPLNKW